MRVYNVYVVPYNKELREMSRGDINRAKKKAIKRCVSVSVSYIKDNLNKHLYGHLREQEGLDNYVWSGNDRTTHTKVTYIVDEVCDRKGEENDRRFLLRKGDQPLIFSVYNHKTGEVHTKKVYDLVDLIGCVHFKQRDILLELIKRVLDKTEFSEEEDGVRRRIPKCKVSYNSCGMTYNLELLVDNSLVGYKASEFSDIETQLEMEKQKFIYFDDVTKKSDLEKQVRENTEKIENIEERVSELEKTLSDKELINRLSSNPEFKRSVCRIVREYGQFFGVDRKIYLRI